MGIWLESLNRLDIFILEFLSLRTLNQNETNMKQIMAEMNSKGFKFTREYFFYRMDKMKNMGFIVQHGTKPKYFITNKEYASDIFNFTSNYLKLEEICRKLSGTKRVK